MYLNKIISNIPFISYKFIHELAFVDIEPLNDSLLRLFPCQSPRSGSEYPFGSRSVPWPHLSQICIPNVVSTFSSLQCRFLTIPSSITISMSAGLLCKTMAVTGSCRLRKACLSSWHRRLRHRPASQLSSLRFYLPCG